ncbi:hypothetical protein ETAA1_37180 [Urbifossiella limnaea]|uniref:Uncharacterized protein n=2 Tax=Urbifossiella limnaea TaxID=2528023 RepID=A0A517XW60_9BACT|nr:hypothetical protein ETAA1_37180 [Urbifossiella limnaea]
MLRAKAHRLLDNLANHHIFQWATFYRDTLREIFADYLRAVRVGEDSAELLAGLESVVAEHSGYVFHRGYVHQQLKENDRETAIQKALNGLERFIDLPLSLFLLTARPSNDQEEVWAARQVGSAMLSGVLTGFGQNEIGGYSGSYLLTRHTRRWAHCLPFLLHNQVRGLSGRIGRGEFASQLDAVVAPVVEAIDRVAITPGLFAYPSISEYIPEPWDYRRLELVIDLPHAAGNPKLEMHVYFSGLSVTRQQLEDSGRRAGLVVVPLKADLEAWVEGHDLLRTVVEDASGRSRQIATRLSERLAAEVTRRRQVSGGAVLVHNYPADFPLEKPSWKKYYFVQRPSVRDLLHSFEHGTGVRLWCSVRRSGKTTAGLELSSATGGTQVVCQTCDTTGDRPDDHRFYTRFVRAIDSNRRLSERFFIEAVTDCLGRDQRQAGAKIVFVLDEYETLFGQLGEIARQDKFRRYSVVQPMLNQMVHFSRENLLVFIGLRPDAHLILTDQNQLMPYVTQDRFPLFTHAAGATEFHELLQKTVSRRCEFDPGFVDAVYSETAGHPTLTVNVLTELFKWLIERKHPADPVRLRADDFLLFMANRLTPAALRETTGYRTMRPFVRGSLTPDARRDQPWLFAVLTALCRFPVEAPQELALPRGDLIDGIRRLGLEGDATDDPDHLLRAAEDANFVKSDGDLVRPRIPLLARLAAASRLSP